MCDVKVAKSEPIERRRLPACVFWGLCAVQVSMLHVNMMLFSYSTSCTARLKASLYTLTPSRKFPLSRQCVTYCLCQIQGDKEKLLYELDTVSAELEKCRMISDRSGTILFNFSVNSAQKKTPFRILMLTAPSGCKRRRTMRWPTSTTSASSTTSCR